MRLSYLEGKKDYHKLSVVKKDFYASNFNYVEGFVSAVLLLLILLGAVMVFIRRIFELLLLYLVSPFFVSTIPLDDGVMFKKWRELFIAKFFSGFGIIFSMRFYLLIIPAIANSNLCLYAAKLPNAAVINSVLKMFLIIGGAWAVYKSQHLIMQILNPEAASADEQASALMKGIIVGSASTAASMAMSAASGGATTAMGALGGEEILLVCWGQRLRTAEVQKVRAMTISRNTQERGNKTGRLNRCREVKYWNMHIWDCSRRYLNGC